MSASAWSPADREAVRPTVRVEIEGAAEGDVAGDPTEARCVDHGICMNQEGRHVHEADACRALAVPGNESLDEAAGRVDPDSCLRLGPHDPAEFHRRGCECNDAMTAMIAVAFIVDEDDAEVGIRRNRLGQIAGVHVGMSARLEDESLAQLVDIVLHPVAPLHDRRAGKARQAADHDPEWLAPGMDFDGTEHSFDMHEESQARADSVGRA